MREKWITLIMNLSGCRYNEAAAILDRSGYLDNKVPWHIRLNDVDSLAVFYSPDLGRYVIHATPGVNTNRWTASRLIRNEIENELTARDEHPEGNRHEE